MENLCLSAASLADSRLHQIVLVFKIFTCFCGLAGDIWIWKYEGTRWLGHPNACLLYALHLFWATVVSISYSIPMIFDLFRFLSPQSNFCSYLVAVFTSFWIRFVPAYAINAQSYAMFMLSLERTIASLFLKRYEKVDKSYLAMILIFLAVTFPALQLGFLIVAPNSWNGRVVATSILTTDNTESYSIHLRLQQILESSTMFLFVFTLLLNQLQARKVKIRDHHVLNLRYQIKETSKVVTSLLPCFCVHFVIFFAPPIILSWRRNMGLTTVDNYRWIEITSEYQLYSLFMPLIIYFLRRREKKKVVVDRHSEMQEYFEKLAASWAVKN